MERPLRKQSRISFSLNNGLEFQEASQTSVEMQLNEHKRTNSDEICKLFLVAPKILTGEANEEEYNNWIKICILPILAAFESALIRTYFYQARRKITFSLLIQLN